MVNPRNVNPYDLDQVRAADKAAWKTARTCAYVNQQSTTDVMRRILSLKEEHKATWRGKGICLWYLGLLEEVIELGLALVGLHHGPVDRELLQIATIAANWLEMHQGNLEKGEAK